MFVKNFATVAEFIAGDHTILKEVLHPQKDGIEISYSLAHARLRPHTASQPHKLTSSELYIILQGTGRMHIDDETQTIQAGSLVFIPPNALQFIENIGDNDLSFFCVVEPYWQKKEETVFPAEN